jgi:hypothetical protein
MKRHICQLCLLAATTMAAPVAFSETSIVKCVDDAGRVTLTDRPCEAGATTVRIASEPANDGVTRAHAHPLVAEASVLPPPRAAQRIHVPVARIVARPLASDIATLKAARAQFVLSDVRSTPALAGLD